MHVDLHLTARASDDKGISRQTIIIIAVCAAVGGLIILAVVVRIIRSAYARSAAQTAPLPPVQPLAHHREHQLAKFYRDNTSRPSTAYDPSNLTAPRPFASDVSSIRTSKASLLVPDSPGPSSPSRHASSLNACDAAEEISLNNAPMELDVPNPSFQVSTRASSSTIGSSENSHTSPETPPLQSSASISRLPHHQTRSTSSARPSSARRPRPLSLASSTHTVASKSSRNNLRTGVPHGPHNQVQIILPAPLAPNIYPNDEISPYRHVDDGGYGRLSVVDQWAPRTYRSEGSLTGESRRSFGSSTFIFFCSSLQRPHFICSGTSTFFIFFSSQHSFTVPSLTTSSQNQFKSLLKFFASYITSYASNVFIAHIPFTAPGTKDTFHVQQHWCR